MVSFKGFETKKEAQNFAKKNGGVVWTAKDGPYSKYFACVHLGGLDSNKYKAVVCWNV